MGRIQRCLTASQSPFALQRAENTTMNSLLTILHSLMSASSASIASLVSAGKLTINTSPATTSASGTAADATATGTESSETAQPLDGGAASSFAAPAGGVLAVVLGLAGLF
jgi:hypothetical protein